MTDKSSNSPESLSNKEYIYTQYFAPEIRRLGEENFDRYNRYISNTTVPESIGNVYGNYLNTSNVKNHKDVVDFNLHAFDKLFPGMQEAIKNDGVKWKLDYKEKVYASLFAIACSYGLPLLNFLNETESNVPLELIDRTNEIREKSMKSLYEFIGSAALQEKILDARIKSKKNTVVHSLFEILVGGKKDFVPPYIIRAIVGNYFEIKKDF